jgi:Undecaprenyl-phosphate glucose phosphotransferase
VAEDLAEFVSSTAALDQASERLRARSTPFSPTIISGLVAIADSLAVLVAGHLLYVAYVGWSPDSYQAYLTVMLVNAAIMLVAFYSADLYNFDSISHVSYRIRKIIPLFGLIFLAMVGLAFALKISDQYSRVWAFGSVATALALICAERIGFHVALRALARSGRITRNLVIIGASEQARALLGHLDSAVEPWIRVIGLFDDRKGRIENHVGGHPVVGTLDDLLAFARAHRVDDVAVALPWSADDRLADIIDKLIELPVHVRLSSDLAEFRYRCRSHSHIGGVQMLDIATKPMAGWKLVAKQIEDRVLGVLLTLVLAPVMLTIAAAIKLETRGPTLFRQRRYGFNNQVIWIYKFRTMFHDRPGERGVPPARPGDRRVSRVGRLLRRTGLDELPQLFNVLAGNMSLIGPRPLAVEHNQRFASLIEGYFARHRVKPGITGWAQVHGFRANTHTPELMKARLEHDLYYIENWSLLLDLQIAVMSLFAMIGGRNAY